MVSLLKTIAANTADIEVTLENNGTIEVAVDDLETYIGSEATADADVITAGGTAASDASLNTLLRTLLARLNAGDSMPNTVAGVLQRSWNDDLTGHTPVKGGELNSLQTSSPPIKTIVSEDTNYYYFAEANGSVATSASSWRVSRVAKANGETRWADDGNFSQKCYDSCATPPNNTDDHTGYDFYLQSLTYA